jgi:S1-C subfamily serine protease
VSKISIPIAKFEAWLKPGVFYALLILLILLNLFVWFGWLARPAPTMQPAEEAELQNKRDSLQALLNAPCDSELIRNYQGIQPALPSGNPAVPGVTTPSTTETPTGLVNLLQSATVMVFHPKGFGTGFFIDSQTIVTNRHVIEGVNGGSVNVGSRTIGGSVKATVVSATRTSDIGGADFALLRIAQPIPGITPLSIT